MEKLTTQTVNIGSNLAVNIFTPGWYSILVIQDVLSCHQELCGERFVMFRNPLHHTGEISAVVVHDYSHNVVVSFVVQELLLV
jgi:hypothetical protein